MHPQRSTALTATPRTMEERRASITALIERTEDPKLKEGMRLILEEMEKHANPSPEERARHARIAELLEAKDYPALEREFPWPKEWAERAERT